jgi:hypothetical protein
MMHVVAGRPTRQLACDFSAYTASARRLGGGRGLLRPLIGPGSPLRVCRWWAVRRAASCGRCPLPGGRAAPVCRGWCAGVTPPRYARSRSPCARGRSGNPGDLCPRVSPGAAGEGGGLPASAPAAEETWATRLPEPDEETSSRHRIGSFADRGMEYLLGFAFGRGGAWSTGALGAAAEERKALRAPGFIGSWQSHPGMPSLIPQRA